MKDTLKVGGAILGLLFAVVWVVNGVQKNKVGGEGNNGVSSDFPMPAPDLRKKMEKAMQEGKLRPPTPQEMAKPGAEEEMRKRMAENFTPEEREQMEKFRSQMTVRMQQTRSAIGDEQMRQLMGRMMQRFGGGRGMRGPRSGGANAPPAAPAPANP